MRRKTCKKESRNEHTITRFGNLHGSGVRIDSHGNGVDLPFRGNYELCTGRIPNVRRILLLYVQSDSAYTLRKAQTKAIIVSAMGASIALKEGARLIWGAIPVSVDKVADGNVNLSGAVIQWQNVAIIGIAAVLMVLVYLLLEKTFIGNIMQATAQDQYMSSLVGVPVIVSIGLTFGVSAMITGIGGGLLAPIFFLNNTMGTVAGAKAFAAIVIGGFGSVPGAIIGGLIVGLVEAFGGAYISTTYQLVLIYVALVLVLMVRPQGIFGEKIQEKA